MNIIDLDDGRQFPVITSIEVRDQEDELLGQVIIDDEGGFIALASGTSANVKPISMGAYADLLIRLIQDDLDRARKAGAESATKK